jgi:nucleotide-binding universal stress UspA family protein
MLPIRTILHPTDFSKSAQYAFRLACSLARDHGARLIVLHVAGPEYADLYSGVPVVQQLEEHARELEEKLHRLKPRHFKLPVEHRLEKGIPADQILRVAQETNCDLIVMGTHGRTGLGRLLMGSVAEEVLRKSPCPVLTVKTPLPAKMLADQPAEHAQVPNA